MEGSMFNRNRSEWSPQDRSWRGFGRRSEPPRGRWGWQEGTLGYDQHDYGRARPQGPRYGADYWWLGEREMERQGHHTPYDAGYVRFQDETHPRFSPVGGMYPPMGGSYARRRPPRPLRESMHFSDWTHWF